LRGFIFVGFIVLFSRLFYLTIVNGEYYKSLSDSNRVREERLQPSRGVIYARDGEVLAGNRPIYKECKTVEKDGFFGTSCNSISREKGIEKEAQGLPVTVELGREYTQKETLSHVLGYMQEIDEKTMKSRNEQYSVQKSFCQNCYGMGDFIGVTGIEEAFEKELRGVPGKRLVEVDSEEKELSQLARIEPISGKNIYTSIDLPLQKKAQEEIEKIRRDPKIYSKGAAVVASNPKTGEIYALYSSPSFDGNAFVGQDKEDSPSLETIFNNPQNPLFDRVLTGLYPPGSIFKIITSAAGLEEGALTSSTKIEDTGIISVGPFSFSNWYFTQYGRREDNVDIVKALARSNDTFFYKVGEWVGIDKLDKWGKIFKTNSTLGIEIPGEVDGMIRRDREWFLGDTYHVAIGQGDVLSSPLHVNTWTQIIANNGLFCKPTLLKKNPPDMTTVFMKSDSVCEPIEIKQETVSLIKEGMEKACLPGGTGWPLFNFSVNTASSSASSRLFTNDNKNFSKLDNGGIGIRTPCKTGTAEFGHPEQRTHAWFTAFAPLADPEIVVTVLIEEGGEGSSIAGPVAKEILSEWFSKDRSN
jgi:penicillin-binding protein 2